jgi:RND family efflux transporter MFP subunit
MKVLLGIVALTMGLASPVWNAETPLDQDPSARILPVETETVQRVSGYEVTEEFSGRVVARRRSLLGFDRGGILAEVGVDEGDRVEQGIVLALLDTAVLEARRRELNAKLAQTLATYQEIEARLDAARATVKRQDGLVADSHVSRQGYEDALFDERAQSARLNATEAAVASVRAEIEVLEAQLTRSRIIAPFGGTIIARLADEGTALRPAEPVLELMEDDPLEVRVGVSESLADSLAAGAVYDMRIGMRTYPAVLRSILPNIDPTTRTAEAVFLVPEQDGQPPRPGQSAVLSITRCLAQPGLWLPVTALTSSRRGLWSAYVAAPVLGEKELMRIERRELQLYHVDSDRAFVNGTLRDGEKVVATGLHRLVPGQVVRSSQPAK